MKLILPQIQLADFAHLINFYVIIIIIIFAFNPWKNSKVSQKLATSSEWTHHQSSVVQQNGIEMKQQN